MTTGKQPIPTAILRNRGSRRANQRQGEPEPQKGSPATPAGLTEIEEAIWSDVTSSLLGMGVLTVVDGAQLHRYAVLSARWIECEQVLRSEGMFYVVDGRNGRQTKPHPALAESRLLDASLRAMEAAYGLTPAARTRLRVAPMADAAGDDLAGFKLTKGVGE